jgi:hypothetical protein
MPQLTREQRLARSEELGILVDEQDEWLLGEFTWWEQHGYIISAIERKHFYIHHMIMGTPIYESEVIDHINRNPVDNTRINLRYATKSQNRINSPFADSGSISARLNGSFIVQLRRKGKWYYGGFYWTREEAETARDRLLKQVQVC